MGRPRGGKAKRPTSQATKNEDPDADADAGSGDEEAVMAAYKRRGRPQKYHKPDDTDDEEDGHGTKVEAMEDSDGARPAVVPVKVPGENGEKKRRRRQPKRGCDSAAEDKDETVKRTGFRHHGSRRKSTPRRAAEAGVECK